MKEIERIVLNISKLNTKSKVVEELQLRNEELLSDVKRKIRKCEDQLSQYDKELIALTIGEEYSKERYVEYLESLGLQDRGEPTAADKEMSDLLYDLSVTHISRYITIINHEEKYTRAVTFEEYRSELQVDLRRREMETEERLDNLMTDLNLRQRIHDRIVAYLASRGFNDLINK